ncbi:MAG: hypothetical protein ACXVKI_03690 [Flavisolibacter sp.]
MKDLNIIVDNESGDFVSSAKIDGCEMVRSKKKLYKRSFGRGA